VIEQPFVFFVFRIQEMTYIAHPIVETNQTKSDGNIAECTWQVDDTKIDEYSAKQDIENNCNPIKSRNFFGDIQFFSFQNPVPAECCIKAEHRERDKKPIVLYSRNEQSS